jgi:hypothetical protein
MIQVYCPFVKHFCRVLRIAARGEAITGALPEGALTMSIFRSRSKAAAPQDPRLLAEGVAPTARFKVGDKVRLTDHFVVFPVRTVGEVLSFSQNPQGYTVLFEYSQPIDVPEQYLESVPPAVPHVFEVGTRVRLTEDLHGIALEKHQPEQESARVGLKAGETAGTVTSSEDGSDNYRVELDRDPLTGGSVGSISVSGQKLVATEGCATVSKAPDGAVRVTQFYRYLDAVATRAKVNMYDGYPLPEGSVGPIRPMSASSPITQEMQESWRTDVYWVYFECADGEPRWQQFPGHLIRLESDSSRNRIGI